MLFCNSFIVFRNWNKAEYKYYETSQQANSPFVLIRNDPLELSEIENSKQNRIKNIINKSISNCMKNDFAKLKEVFEKLEFACTANENIPSVNMENSLNTGNNLITIQITVTRIECMNVAQHFVYT